MLVVTLATVGAQRVSVRDRAQGILPPAGHRPPRSAAIQADQDTSFQACARSSREFVEIIVQRPGGGQRGRLHRRRRRRHHQHRADVRRRSSRSTSASVGAEQVIARLRRKLTGVPGAHAVSAGGAGPARRRPAQQRRSISTRCRATTCSELNTGRRDAAASCARCRELADVNSDQQDRGLQAALVIDRDTASRLGITPQVIDDTLYDAFGQRQVSTMYTPLNQYHVVMEVEPQFWQSPDALRDIYVALDRRARRCR